MNLLRQYLKAIRDARKLFIYTFLLCFALMIYLPFLMIALRSVGRGWAAAVFFLDLAKGLGPMILARLVFFPGDAFWELFVIAAADGPDYEC